MVVNNTSKVEYLIRYKRKPKTRREKKRRTEIKEIREREQERKKKNHNPKIEASKQRTPIAWDSREIVTHVVSLQPFF
jgi:hypothetical protein